VKRARERLRGALRDDRAILFDLDGTLLDVATAVREAATALFDADSSDRTFEQFLHDWMAAGQKFDPEAHPGEHYLSLRRARVREAVNPSLDDRAADKLFMAYQQALEAAWTLHEDVLPCLDALAGKRLGIVSNGLGLQQRAKLKKTGIAGRFDCVVVSSEVGMRKPEPEIFLYACRRMGVAPSHTIHVGDRYGDDAVGARQAGLVGVWLDREGTRSEEHEPPIVSDLCELIAMIQSQVP
jgi:putative hydrolase of the HAD superfamily